MIPGYQLTPSLRLVRPIGIGGMGVVWLAEHATLHTMVAVKLLTEKHLRDARAVARFADEAAASARIASPHIVRVFDQGISEGTSYIVMELLRGETLAERLRREPSLATVETVAIATQICSALTCAKEAGVVHRDIKPSNVFLTQSGGQTWVKLLDFGLAKLTKDWGDSTQSGAVFGTPFYISPEQLANAGDATHKSDLWSLAVLVYQCFSGALPFQSDSLLGLCAVIGQASYQPISQLRADLPATLDAWFARALALDPADRFVDADQMAAELAACSAFPGPSESPPGIVIHSSARVAASSPAARWWPLLAVVVVATLGLSIPLGRLMRREPHPPAVGVVKQAARSASSEDAAASVTPLVSPATAVSSGAPTPQPTLTPSAAAPAGKPRPAAAVATAGTPARLAMVSPNGLYDEEPLRREASKYLVSINACLEHEEVQGGRAAYIVELANTGAIIRIYQVPNAVPSIDACIVPWLRRMNLGATFTGRQGQINLGYVRVE